MAGGSVATELDLLHFFGLADLTSILALCYISCSWVCHARETVGFHRKHAGKLTASNGQARKTP
jgi:hypothetical protein